MAAPNLETLLDFETNFETASKTFLETATGLTASSTYATLDQDTFIVPRLEVMFELGGAMDPPAPKILNSSTVEYIAHEGTLTIRVVSDASVNGTQTNHRIIRGKVRGAMLLNADNFTTTAGETTILPYYDVKYLRPTGTDFEIDGDLAISNLTYAVTFSIKEDAFPESVFNNANAIFSLRKFLRYSGNAVRIRRTSDNIEVDVLFDSEGKVSSSSAITNVAEQGGEIMNTSATTLGEFISYRNNIIGNSEFNTVANLGFDDGGTASPLWNKAGSGSGSSTFTSNTTETTDPNGGNTAAKFQWSASGTNWLRQETELAGGVEVTFSAYYKQLGSQTTVRHNYWKGNSDVNVVLDFSNGTISEAPSGGSAPTSSAVENVGNGWYRVSMVLTTVAATVENKAQPARQPIGVTGGGVYVWGAMLEVGNTLGTYVKTTSEIPNGVATVYTWYNQAGSNNAVQETAGNQPKIAENGSLLADGIKFDGTDDNLLLGDICDNINNFSAFMFAKSDGGTGETQICWSQGASGDSNIFYQGRNDANVLFGYAATANTTSSTVSQFENGFLFTSIAGSLTAKSFGNAVESVSVSSSSSNPSSSSNKIGSHFSANYFDGSIQELVFFNSDQSNNRTIIENNINDYYNIYS